ncbi:isopentenyl phosphate kinase isoform X2 [Diospyros lotus]|uniref:isopentenyl phosphate kinase isoform X2 n=1 Tax=Diospyros lotus TaxID=55363 RepID=UPI002251E87B|nr:isopentenyl phosphate kinase isoform X2 [Diospyros lotus]
MRDFAIPALGRTSASIREEAEYSLRRAEAEAHMASGDQNHQRSTSKVLITKPLRCIVKLGGAAITCKNELEMLNEGGLEIVSRQLRQAMMASGSYSSKVLGMDWSKRPGFAEPSCVVDDFIDQQALALSHFIVVHGAGSFGHFQASKSGVHKGGVSQPLVKAGFVATRISVTSLNLEIVRALAREGVPSIGMSPFACGWLMCKNNIASADLSMVGKAIESGFVPVLHGDAVLDESQGCTILSGDVIIRHLAEHLKPEFIVFLTDVLGVYDRPPTEDNAVLLREIEVYEDGNWSVVKPSHGRIKEQVKVTVASHDTTGGMLTKIAEAVTIAKLGIDVFVVKAGTSHSLSALLGEVRDSIPDDWLGTAFRFQKWNK